MSENYCIVTKHENKVRIAEEVGCTLSLVGYALLFKSNSVKAKLIRSKAMNEMKSFLVPR